MAELEMELEQANKEFNDAREAAVTSFKSMSMPGVSGSDYMNVINRMLAASDKVDDIRNRIRLYKVVHMVA